MRDAAGQLSDRFEPLRLAQRVFRHFAAFRFLVQPLGALERDPQHAEEQSSVAGRPNIRYAPIAESHSARISPVSMPASA